MGNLRVWAALACLAAAPSLVVGVGSVGVGGGGTRARNLVDLEEFINNIFKEKYAVEDMLQAAQAMQPDIASKIQDMQSVTLPAFQSTAAQQDQCLEEIRMKIQSLLGELGPMENALAGQKAISGANEANVNHISDRVDDLRSTNNKQSASLVGLATTLAEAKEKLEEKGQELADQTRNSVDELDQNILSANQQLPARKCIQDMAAVNVDGESGAGSVDVVYSPQGVLGGSVPSTVCLLESFQSELRLGRTRVSTYGYNQPEAAGHRRTAALTVDCQPLTDRVKVMAFDQSEGEDNSMTKAFVTIKACTPN